MRRQICNISNIYLSLWCIYNLQGTLYESGSTISRFSLAVLLVISLYYFFFANYRYKLPKVLKILSLLLLIWTFYGVFPLMYGTDSGSHYYLKDIFCSLLPIYSFFVFSKKGILNIKQLKCWGCVFVLIGIAQFYRFQKEEINALLEIGRSVDNVTNNAGYIMLSLLPIIPLYFKKPIIQYVLLGIVMFYILIGMKRGAVVIGTVAIIWLFYNQWKIKKGTSKKILRLLLTMVLFIIMVYLVHKYLLQNEYFNQRLEKTLSGDSSGRDVIYNTLLHGFLNQISVFSFLFGNGAFATLRLFGVLAHNDWLEIAINNGLWVVILYCIYWLNLLRTVHNAPKNSISFLIIGLFFIIYFAKSFISMSYFSIPVYATSALGYALATYENV